MLSLLLGDLDHKCRDSIEHQIAWKPKIGSSLFWLDNWKGLGALYFVTPLDFFGDESIQNVYEMLQGNRWEYDAA